MKKVTSLGSGIKRYNVNKEVYLLLRYGVKEKDGLGEHTQTVWLIERENPEANDFAVAEEVSIKGEQKNALMWCYLYCQIRRH